MHRSVIFSSGTGILCALILGAVGLFTGLPRAHAAASLVQSASVSSVTWDGATTTFPGITTAGDTIIVTAFSNNGNSSYFPQAPTDSQANTYTELVATSSPDFGSMFLWTATSSVSASDTVTLHASVGQVAEFASILETSGVNGTALDGAAAVNGCSASPCSAGNVTTTQDGDFVLGVFGRITGISFSPISPFTTAASSTNGGTEYEIQASAGAVNPSASVTATSTYPVETLAAAFAPSFPSILSVATSSSLSYTATVSSTATTSQSVTISNTGPATSTLDWTATSNQSWLTFGAASGSVAGGASSSLSLIVDPSGLALGTYNATATITANAQGSPVTLPVTLTVSLPANQTSTAPRFLMAVPQDASAVLYWSAPSSTGGSSLTQYTVDYKLDASSTYTQYATTTPSVTSSTISGLTNGSLYDFEVTAQNNGGASDPSNVATSTPSASAGVLVEPPTPPLAGYDNQSEIGAPSTSTMAGYTQVAVTDTGNAATNAANLQTDINSASCGTVISLPAGAEFEPSSGTITLPAKSCASGSWIVIRSAASDASLPAAGTRITPSYKSDLPTILASVANASPIQINASANNYLLEFLDVTVDTSLLSGSSTDSSASLINIGDGTYGSGGTELTSSTQPTNIIVDRDLIEGSDNPPVNFRRGVELSCSRCAVINSYIDQIHELSYDSQAIAGYNATGPWLIDNNYLSAATENFMAGGAASNMSQNPSDITFTHNLVYKPLTWDSGDPSFTPIPGFGTNAEWDIKNSFELKSAVRVLVKGNIFENSWPSNQEGRALAINPASGNGDDTVNPWTTVSDVNVTDNKFENTWGMVSISGLIYSLVGVQTARISVANNLGINQGLPAADANESSPAFQYIFLGAADNGGGEPAASTTIALGVTHDVSINHNTAVLGSTISTPLGAAFSFEGYIITGESLFPNWAFNNNILSVGTNGVSSGCTLNGTSTLCFPTPDAWRNDLVYDTATSTPVNWCSTANNSDNGATIYATYAVACPVADVGAVGFVDASSSNFALASSSPGYLAGNDGTDVGANITALDAALADATPVTTSTAPQSLAATAGDGQVSLSWSAPSSNGGSDLTQYDVNYKLAASSTYAQFTTTAPSVTTSTVTGLTNGSLYDFEIIAENAIGTSTPSNVATATPTAAGSSPTYYVSFDGSDTNNGTSSGAALLTIAKLMTTSVVSVPSSSTVTSTASLTFANAIDITPAANLTITIPASTTLTTATATDFTAFIATTTVDTSGLPSGYTSQGTLAFGLPFSTVTLGQAITIAIPVSSSLDGQSLSVYREEPGSSTWTDLTTCTVSSSTCSFTTSNLSSFVAASSNTSSGGVTVIVAAGGGGGGYIPPANATSTATSTPTASSTASTASSTASSSLSSSTVAALTTTLNALESQLLTLIKEAAQQGIAVPNIPASIMPTPTTAYAFTRDLQLRDRGNDVKTLQSFLIKAASGPAASALSTAGPTGYFGPLTYDALKEYQKNHNIPDTGYFGPITRKAVGE